MEKIIFRLRYLFLKWRRPKGTGNNHCVLFEEPRIIATVHSQKCFLMPRKCFLDIVTKHLFSLPKDSFFLAQEFSSCSKKKFLIARKRILAARKM